MEEKINKIVEKDGKIKQQSEIIKVNEQKKVKFHGDLIVASNNNRSTTKPDK